MVLRSTPANARYTSEECTSHRRESAGCFQVSHCLASHARKAVENAAKAVGLVDFLTYRTIASRSFPHRPKSYWLEHEGRGISGLRHRHTYSSTGGPGRNQG